MSKKQQEEPQPKSFTELSEQIKPILAKPFEERNQEDLEQLIQLASTIKYFQKNYIENNQQEQLQQLCQVMKAEQVPQGKHLFKIGQEGTKFYLILNGKISLRVPNKQKIKELLQILVLQAGQTFGETALVQRVERSSNMVTVSDSYLLTIDRLDLQQLQQKQDREQQEQQQQSETQKQQQ